MKQEQADTRRLRIRTEQGQTLIVDKFPAI